MHIILRYDKTMFLPTIIDTFNAFVVSTDIVRELTKFLTVRTILVGLNLFKCSLLFSSISVKIAVNNVLYFLE